MQEKAPQNRPVYLMLSAPSRIILLIRANVFLGVCTVTIEDVCCFQVTHGKVGVMSCNAVPVHDNIYNRYLSVIIRVGFQSRLARINELEKKKTIT